MLYKKLCLEVSFKESYDRKPKEHENTTVHSMNHPYNQILTLSMVQSFCRPIIFSFLLLFSHVFAMKYITKKKLWPFFYLYFIPNYKSIPFIPIPYAFFIFISIPTIPFAPMNILCVYVLFVFLYISEFCNRQTTTNPKKLVKKISLDSFSICIFFFLFIQVLILFWFHKR